MKVLLFMLISCKTVDEPKIRDHVLHEKDLVPEGVAFDRATETIYVSSTHKRKIVAIDKNGNIKDFISEAQDDIKSVIGMEVDEKTNSLWAVSCEAADVLPLKDPAKEQWRSSVYHFNLSDGKLLGKYPLNKDTVFLNDLTVGDDGTVYITESIRNGLYIIRPGSDSIELFLELKPYHFINGISFTDKPGYLFVASTEGIIKINLASKNYSLLPESGSLKALGIDGLSFQGDYFIAHQSTAVTRFHLSPARDSIVKADTLNTGQEFDGSTTGEVANDNYYFIVNSQVRSAVDFKNKRLKPPDSLSPVIIRKMRL
jgi:DNA-binding beta-propeller fold protein YncE